MLCINYWIFVITKLRSFGHIVIPKKTLPIMLCINQMRCLSSSIFVLAMSQFDNLIAKKKLKLWGLLVEVEGFILKYKVSPLWPKYIGERKTTFAKAYGIKVRCYQELFGEHVRNFIILCFDHHRKPSPKKRRDGP